jgi:hypothetical protein
MLESVDWPSCRRFLCFLLIFASLSRSNVDIRQMIPLCSRKIKVIFSPDDKIICVCHLMDRFLSATASTKVVKLANIKRKQRKRLHEGQSTLGFKRRNFNITSDFRKGSSLLTSNSSITKTIL